MNKRQRKKWLKQHGQYVNPKDCWDLDYTIAEFILPRLKRFKKDTNGYPGRDDADTFEKWMQILDDMIIAFEYIVESDDWWLYDKRYNYTSGLHFNSEPTDKDGLKRLVINREDWVDEVEKAHNKEEQRRQEVINKGLDLFRKYYFNLWW